MRGAWRLIASIAPALLAAAGAFAAQTLAPPPALVADGMPPIPAALGEALAPYGEFRPHALLSWHPTRREMLVRRRLDATNQVHLVTEPGVAPRPLTDFADAVDYATYQPMRGDYFVFPRGEGGDEVHRLYRYDFATRAVTPLSPAGERASRPEFDRAGERIVYTTQPVDRNDPQHRARTIVHVMDPSRPESDRVLARLEGGGWTDFRFSEDGRRLAYTGYVSANQSNLWVMDALSGRSRRVTRQPPHGTVAYASPRFSRDGKGLYATTDRGSEFQRLVYVPLGAGRERVLTPRLAFDVDDFEPSFDAGMIAFVTNEHGSHVLRFLDIATGKELPRPPLFDGVIGGLRWRRGSAELGFHVTSARTAGDVFSYDVKTNKLTRWTNGNNPKLNTSAFVEPRLVRWRSFDGRAITGFLYRPPARFTGKRPVIVSIHGGPEAQFRPGFIGRNNYLVDELGIAIVYPNVRGSSGFGKTFLELDNGRHREDAVRDIGALLDWIRGQPDLDADRVGIAGGSYGGSMSLACAAHFADRIVAAQDIVGISDFVTFLEHTESYRRDLRRAQYGDERDSAMRAFLGSISPLEHAERITKPLFVVQGLNDPRVPHTEAGQIVAGLKKRGTPVWFLLAKDEGHGFAKKPNVDYLFAATVEFWRRYLLP